MIDIDHFKEINDLHGHLMGDEVLVRLSQSMQSTLRESDLLFRYGGEEFAVIFPAENKADALNIIQRLRSGIEKINLSQVGNVTVSVGLTEMKREIFHLKSIEMADKALYTSKSNGRNTVSFFDNQSNGLSETQASSSELF